MFRIQPQDFDGPRRRVRRAGRLRADRARSRASFERLARADRRAADIRAAGLFAASKCEHFRWRRMRSARRPSRDPRRCRRSVILPLRSAAAGGPHEALAKDGAAQGGRGGEPGGEGLAIRFADEAATQADELEEKLRRWRRTMEVHVMNKLEGKLREDQRRVRAQHEAREGDDVGCGRPTVNDLAIVDERIDKRFEDMDSRDRSALRRLRRGLVVAVIADGHARLAHQLRGASAQEEPGYKIKSARMSGQIKRDAASITACAKGAILKQEAVARMDRLLRGLLRGGEARFSPAKKALRPRVRKKVMTPRRHTTCSALASATDRPPPSSRAVRMMRRLRSRRDWR